MAGRAQDPWGGNVSRKPRIGAGREALAKRTAPRERPATVEAARRGLHRAKNRVRRSHQASKPGPIRGAAAKLRAFAGLFEQRFLDRKRLRHILLAFAAIWALWTFVLGDAGLPRLWSIRRSNTAITHEIEAMKERETELRKRVGALEDPSDLRALEEVAREEHALVREGEVLVRFTEPED